VDIASSKDPIKSRSNFADPCAARQIFAENLKKRFKGFLNAMSYASALFADEFPQWNRNVGLLFLGQNLLL
jgi:hypothetical protein